MNKFGKIIADGCKVFLLASIALALSTVSATEAAADISALAAETHKATANGLEWTYMLQDGKAVLGGGRRTVHTIATDTEGIVEIPSLLDGHPVVAVGNYAFCGCDRITGVSFPAGIVSIGKDAFYGASSLASISIPQGVAFLGSGVLEECSSLVTVSLPDTLSFVPESAFAFCESLESLTIPATVVSIGEYAFDGCDVLSQVTFMGAAPEMGLSGLFDLDAPPTIVCRMAHYAAFRALAAEGQRVVTFDGSGLVATVDSVDFGDVGLDTRDSETVVFENTSMESITVMGVGHSGFSSAPVEKFYDSSAVEGWTFSPASAWGVVNGELSSCTNGRPVANYRYCFLPGVYKDFTVQADIRLNDYDYKDGPLGILLRADERFSCQDGSGWLFQILPSSGSYVVSRCEDGIVTPVVKSTPSSAIVKYGSLNTFSVAACGPNYSLSINGTVVWTGSDDALSGAGRVGFFNYDGGNGSYITVDNVRIMSGVFSNGDKDAEEGSFSFAAEFPFSVASGERFELPLSFKPLKTGPLSSTLSLVSSAGSSVGVRACGIGVEDELAVSGEDSMLFAGHTGGPFAPNAYEFTVRNTSRRDQSFTVTTPEWLSCSETSVAIPAGSETNLTFNLVASATDMATGKYAGTVELLHVENGHRFEINAQFNSYVTGSPVLPGAEIVVTNRIGQVQERIVAVGNAAASDGPLAAQLTAYETGREEATRGSTKALSSLKATRRAAGLFTLAKGSSWSQERILVRFDPDRLSKSQGGAKPDYAAAVSRIYGGRVVKTYGIVPGLVLVELPGKAAKASDMESTIRAFEADDNVVYAEPNYTLKALRAPNDAMYSALWGMNNAGQDGGKPGSDISAERAWDITTGSREIVVGVIDSGVNYNHPDLVANMWRNPGEIPDNGIDDDGNGYIDDVYGINAITADGDPMDDNHHGTHCAGTIGGVGNNGIGVAGVCWKVSIMALKFLNAEGRGGDADAIDCIEYAIEKGAKVLSNSWGGPGFNQAMKDAIDSAKDAGIIFIAAAGNESSDNDKTENFPSGYDCDNIISVVSTDNNDLLSTFSNYGATTCHLAAPGTRIYSCSLGTGYEYLSGTSMATPHVAGAAALLLSRNPSMTPEMVKEALMSTVDKLDSLAGKCVTEGRMNVFEALKTVQVWATLSPEVVEGILPGASANTTVTFDAGSLPLGEYTGTIRATALDEDGAVAYMPIRMVVIGDELTGDVSVPLAASQTEGDNGSSDSLLLSFSNSGGEDINWTLSSSAGWLVPELFSGMVAAGGSQQVNLSVSGSKALAAGRHEAVVTLENTATGARLHYKVVLTVAPGTGPLYVDPVNGDDANHGRLAEYPMRTLNGAVGRATDGTEIQLADGVYEPVTYTRDATFCIRGVNGCKKVYIDGGDASRCCTFIADEDYVHMADYKKPCGTNVTVIGVTLKNGRATGVGTRVLGGAAYGGRYENCCMLDCSAEKNGGAACFAILDRCEVRGNTAGGSDGGGLYYCDATDTLIAGNMITYNSTANGGGVAYGSLNGCTVVGNGCLNTYSSSCPGIYMAAVTNTIAWGNSRNGDTSVSQANVTKSRSLLTIDPCFRAPEDGLYTLTAGSPAVDMGFDTAVVNDLDLAGNPRIQGDHVDIGCYEGVDERPCLFASVRGAGALSAPYAYAEDGSASLTAIETVRRFLRWEDENGDLLGTEPTIVVPMGDDLLRRAVAVFELTELYVDAENGNDANDGTDVAPLRTIGAAIAKSVAGETIHVAAGTYEPISTDGKAVTIIGAGIGMSVIDGGSTNRCATLGDTTNGTVLVGFTLRNGYAFTKNNANKSNGGGAYYGRLVSCEIVGNYAGNNGGGAYYSLLESCLVAGNVAGSYSGGIYYGTTYNCSIVGNKLESIGNESAGFFGGVHYNVAVAGNVDGSGKEANGSTYYCRTYRIGASQCGMVDPFHGDARPRPGSPLIDAGNDAYVTSDADVTGEQRIQGNHVDIGCYEGVRYTGLVAMTKTEGHGIVEPESALFEPGGAVTFRAVEDGRTFMYFKTNGVVATTARMITIEGMTRDFEVTAVFERKAIYVDPSAPAGGDGMSAEKAVRSFDMAIDLAYDGETVFVAPGIYEPISIVGKRLDIRATGGRDETVIDGGGTARCANLGVAGDAGTFLSGFTLRNGFVSDNNGGGVIGGVLSNCVVTANVASNSYCYGGATYDTDLYDCVVFANTSIGVYSAYAGASYNRKAYRTAFSNNTARSNGAVYGGAAYNMTTYDCLFVGNSAHGEGSTPGKGGAVYYGSHYNATITRNSADAEGGGAWNVNLYNAIVYGNVTASGTYKEMYSSREYIVCTNDPQFVNADAGDFRLAVGSPCINFGNNDNAQRAIDIAGNPRIQDGKVDLGCYEGAVEPPAAATATTTTPVPVEYSWLEQYPEILSTFGGDYEAMANAQSPGTPCRAKASPCGKTWPDGTPYYMWQDYVAGTVPTNSESVFSAKIEIVDGNPVVTWEPKSAELDAIRDYKIKGKRSLLDIEWDDVSNLEDKSGYHFFSVEVIVK